MWEEGRKKTEKALAAYRNGDLLHI